MQIKRLAVVMLTFNDDTVKVNVILHDIVYSNRRFFKFRISTTFQSAFFNWDVSEILRKQTVNVQRD